MPSITQGYKVRVEDHRSPPTLFQSHYLHGDFVRQVLCFLTKINRGLHPRSFLTFLISILSRCFQYQYNNTTMELATRRIRLRMSDHTTEKLRQSHHLSYSSWCSLIVMVMAMCSPLEVRGRKYLIFSFESFLINQSINQRFSSHFALVLSCSQSFLPLPVSLLFLLPLHHLLVQRR